jgi:hypothetical protein
MAAMTTSKENINQADDSNPNKNISIQRIRKQSQSAIPSAEVFQSKKKEVAGMGRKAS